MRGGEGNGFWLINAGRLGVREPSVELRQWVAVELGDFEGAFCELLGLC